MNEYEARKNARDDLGRVIKQDAEHRGIQMTHDQVMRKAEERAERQDKRADYGDHKRR